VAAVDQRGELDRSRAAEVVQGIEGRAYGAAGVQDVVDQHHDAVVDAFGWQLGTAEGSRGPHAQVVAVHRDVEGALRDRVPLDLLDAAGEALGERDPSCRDSEEDDVPATFGALKNLVSDPGQGTAYVRCLENRLVTHVTIG
jgi:hypothetical protein